MTQEIQEIRALAREFAAAELRPHTEQWDAEAALGAGVVKMIAELGFFGMLVPESEGGMGFDAVTYAAALEELAWGEAGVAVLVAHSVMAADLIVKHGSGLQKQSWLGPLAAGELTGCIAFAEGADGSRSSGRRTRARSDGDGWLLNGRKSWVTNGDGAAVAIVLAATDEGPALFIVPAADMNVAGRAATLGLRSVAVVDVDLDARLDNDCLLTRLDSEPDGGGDWLGRLSTATIAVGIAQAALDHAIRYAGEREQFGRPIRMFEGIQHKLAEMATRVTAARALVGRSAADPADVSASAMAKLLAAECAMYVTSEAVQVFGGYGYMKDYPVEKLMRDAAATGIMHGSSETQRLRIAQSLYV
jgi:alkylation response protein AidB-like acyl-CoA dehydrogenase